MGTVVVLLAAAGVYYAKYAPPPPSNTDIDVQCAVAPFREQEVADLIADGAVVGYHRVAGPRCVDELFAIYADGRIVGDDGVNRVEKQIDPGDVEHMLTVITAEHNWFTAEVFSTYLTPCRQCFAHYVSISYDGQVKAATGTDGTTAMPPDFLFSIAEIRPLLPEIKPAP
jgi:hypothetical protein